jgi:hypothetical protein
MPEVGRDLDDPILDAGEAQPLCLGHRQHVAEPLLLQPAAQRMVGTVDAVGGDPGEGQAGSIGALEHRQAELGLGGEPDNLGDAGRGAPGSVRHSTVR